MIARRGRILAVQDGMATIRIDTPAACASCGSRGACGSTGTTVRLPVADALRAGDDVTLTLAEGALVRGALRAYLLPATTLLLGAIALSAFGDLAAVGGALSGLGVGLIVQRILASRAACAPPAVAPAPTFDLPPLWRNPMSAAAAVLERDPIYETDFIKEMIRQMRALDSYGTYDGQPGEKLLEPLIMTKARKAQIPIVGDPDEETIACVKAFYNAIAVLIEKECGQMAVPLVHLSHEGFGRALITVGKLVVSDRTLRDVHRFGFESLSKMKTEADKILAVALEIIGAHPDVAGM